MFDHLARAKTALADAKKASEEWRDGRHRYLLDVASVQAQLSIAESLARLSEWFTPDDRIESLRPSPVPITPLHHRTADEVLAAMREANLGQRPIQFGGINLPEHEDFEHRPKGW